MKKLEEEITTILAEVSASKTKIDKLLEMDADIYCNCGTDSTKAEMKIARSKSARIYKAIKTIDVYFGAYLLKSKD